MVAWVSPVRWVTIEQVVLDRCRTGISPILTTRHGPEAELGELNASYPLAHITAPASRR